MTAARPRITLSLVATRRPDLLRRTFDSFEDALFGRVEIERVVANLDPVFGSDVDHAEVLAIIRGRFPDAQVREPDAGSFGAAVKWLWSQMPDGPILHMEEDWIAREPIDAARAEDWLDDTVKAVSFSAAVHGRKAEKAFSTGREKRRLFGLLPYHVRKPRFNTSPGVFDGAFVRECAEMMDPALDPEKQMRPPHNPTLNAYLDRYCCRFLKASDGGHLIEDIGRDWRAAHDIRRVFVDGKPEWQQGEAPSP